MFRPFIYEKEKTNGGGGREAKVELRRPKSGEPHIGKDKQKKDREESAKLK